MKNAKTRKARAPTSTPFDHEPLRFLDPKDPKKSSFWGKKLDPRSCTRTPEHSFWGKPPRFPFTKAKKVCFGHNKTGGPPAVRAPRSTFWLRDSTRFCVFQNQNAHFLDNSELDPHPFAHSGALFLEHPSGFFLQSAKIAFFLHEFESGSPAVSEMLEHFFGHR
jgi:hypothetical protein